MRNKARAALTLLAIILISIASIVGVHGELYDDYKELTEEELEKLMRGLPMALELKIISTSLTTILIIGIMVVHVRVYRETRTRFSLGLVIFSAALILYTLASNPILYRVLGIGYAKRLNPLLILPDVFMAIAAAILLYLSRQ